MAKERYTPRPVPAAATHPFDNVEDAWFWFIQAQDARNEGARHISGLGLYGRPCEPVDILRVLDRLHRDRELDVDHLMVLRHYGFRMMAPDPHRPLEYRASRLWAEAMAAMEAPLVKKGIVARRADVARFWGGSVVVPVSVLQGAMA